MGVLSEVKVIVKKESTKTEKRYKLKEISNHIIDLFNNDGNYSGITEKVLGVELNNKIGITQEIDYEIFFDDDDDEEDEDIEFEDNLDEKKESIIDDEQIIIEEPKFINQKEFMIILSTILENENTLIKEIKNEVKKLQIQIQEISNDNDEIALVVKYH